MTLKLTQEECTKLINNCQDQFEHEFPGLDSEQMRVNMGMIMLVLGTTNAPMNTVEFIEAMRYVANILDVAFKEGRKES